MQLKKKSLLYGFVPRLLVCVRYVKGMLICALFGMRELNTSDFRTSELRALNIEYSVTCTEKRAIAPLT